MWRGEIEGRGEVGLFMRKYAPLLRAGGGPDGRIEPAPPSLH